MKSKTWNQNMKSKTWNLATWSPHMMLKLNMTKVLVRVTLVSGSHHVSTPRFFSSFTISWHCFCLRVLRVSVCVLSFLLACLSVCRCERVLACLSMRSIVSLSVDVSVCLFVCLSVCLCACLCLAHYLCACQFVMFGDGCWCPASCIVVDVGNYKWHNHFGSQGTRIGYCVPFLSLNVDLPGLQPVAPACSQFRSSASVRWPVRRWTMKCRVLISWKDIQERLAWSH